MVVEGHWGGGHGCGSGPGMPSAEGSIWTGWTVVHAEWAGLPGEQQPSPNPLRGSLAPWPGAWERERSTQRLPVAYVGTQLDWSPASKHIHLTEQYKC